MTNPSIEMVLSQFGADGGEWQDLGAAGGFSGARLWRGHAFGRLHCLRRWPSEHPSRVRLQFIHDVLSAVQSNGFDKIPVPRQLSSGTGSFVELKGSLWQLEPWMEGEADFHRAPSKAKATNGLVALAQFHRALANWPGPTSAAPIVSERVDGLEHLQRSIHLMAAARVDVDATLEFASRALVEYVQLAATLIDSTKADLARFVDVRVPLRPAIRDIWSEHIFYRGNDVTGFVDFGTMRLDWKLADVSRLLGSLDQGTGQFWDVGLSAYCDAAGVDHDATALVVSSLDSANVLLAPYHWLNWLLFERRRFESLARVRERLAAAMARLRSLSSRDGLISS